MRDKTKPCGNEDCDKCDPRPRWKVATVSVQRIQHEREIKATTPEEARSIYDQGTAWPSSYDERTLQVIEESPTTVTQVTDEYSLEYHRTGCCWHDLELPEEIQ